jgi:hypothetical protein
MVILTAILFVVVIFGLFFLFRASGRLGQRPEPGERASHAKGEGKGPGPRATGLN